MTEASSWSYKNLISGVVSLAVTLFVILAVFLALQGSISGVGSSQFWTTYSVYLGIVSVFTAFIETTLVPRLKSTGLLRILFVYYALGTFLAVVLVVLLLVMSGGTAYIMFYALLGLYAWMVYVLNVSAARPLYPVLHKLLWKESV
ncbi:MAG: hypothetical protein RL605_545 [Actinomycetota bacterium]|jgi:hypothetical protein